MSASNNRSGAVSAAIVKAKAAKRLDFRTMGHLCQTSVGPNVAHGAGRYRDVRHIGSRSSLSLCGRGGLRKAKTGGGYLSSAPCREIPLIRQPSAATFSHKGRRERV